MVFVDHKCVIATIVIVQHKHNNLSQEEIDNKECSYTYGCIFWQILLPSMEKKPKPAILKG